MSVQEGEEDNLNLRKACNVETNPVPDQNFFTYMDGTCTQNVAFEESYFYLTAGPNYVAEVIRYETNTVDDDQCCRASLDASSQEEQD